MVGTKLKWEDELGRWLKPFLDRLGHKARRRMCPLYISGLIGPGDRKSVQPMAARLAPGEYDRLHHFIADGVWDAAPLEAELLVQAELGPPSPTRTEATILSQSVAPRCLNAQFLASQRAHLAAKNY